MSSKIKVLTDQFNSYAISQNFDHLIKSKTQKSWLRQTPEKVRLLLIKSRTYGKHIACYIYIILF